MNNWLGDKILKFKSPTICELEILGLELFREKKE
jgi:hypothetical protein